MDKNIIKSFAIDSRRKMIESVKYQSNLIGITADRIESPISKAKGMETYDYGAGTYTIFDEDIEKRESLVKEVQKKGFENVVEEVAYTWFNRLIAIRYMEVNDFLPTRTRVLSSETEGKIEPDIITEALDLDLDYTEEDKEKIFKLKDENKLDDLFQFLFIRQCNKLNETLPGLFEKTADWMEILLNISFTNENGIIRRLVDTIPEEDFGNQVEIIGWLYQYYNTELKDETFAMLKKKGKITKERIPAATQLFTPDWIVKYMVENSLGKLWLEGHPNQELKNKWKYLVEDAHQEKEVEFELNKIRKESELLSPEDIKIIDPCMGSGHILVYVFDVLMQIYVSEGFTEKDAAEYILKYNIYGLDIDDRAYQLSYFAVLMKAREYNRKILNKNINPIICSIKESNFSKDFLSILSYNSIQIKEDLEYIVDLFKDAKNLGSIIKIKKINFENLENFINNIHLDNLDFINYQNDLELLKSVIKQLKILSLNYDIVITNPPYMSQKGMNLDLKEFLKINYPLTKRDLFAVFIERCLDMVKDKGFCSLVTMQSWMFLSSFEDLRNNIYENHIITNLIHMDNMVMGIAFGTSATVFRKLNIKNFKGTYNQVNYKDIDENNVPYEFPIRENKNNVIDLESFKYLPGRPIAYWVNKNLVSIFDKGVPLINFGLVGTGLQTNDNKRFVRLWFEVDFTKIGFGCSNSENTLIDKKKWYPYNKGGFFRKWYGNQDYIVNYENDGHELKKYASDLYKSYSRTMKNIKYYFKPSLSWTKIASKISFRYYPEGFVFDIAGCSVFLDENIYYIFGFLNSSVCSDILDLLSPTMNYEVGHISSIPLIFDENYNKKIEDLVLNNVELCKNDWDDYELSWNFKSHPFIRFKKNTLKDTFACWEQFKINKFNILKSNERKLNILFSEIYSINTNCDVDDKYVSITKADYEKDIKSFISYSVGCMFGRYSLDEGGLIFAGGQFDLNRYKKFIPDDDNIIPVLDTEYFEDDIVGRFIEFVKVCFGEESLEENLEFIANALNKKGKTSREIIRNYFLTDFFKEHHQTYKKSPFYWQFDSGKQNAFKCLVYMHRYEPGIVARVRTDYLHKTQKAIEQNIDHCDSIITNSTNKSEVNNAKKDKNKCIKQLDEIKSYDEALGHIANQQIEIDLDDGVKVNHSKFQNVEVSVEGEKVQKINLLKKI